MATLRRSHIARLAAAICLQWLLLPAGAALADHDPREQETRGHEGSGHEGSGREGSGHEGRDSREDRSGPSDSRDNSGKEGESGRTASDKDGRRNTPRIEFERDARGRERVRDEVLIACKEPDVARIRDAGFTIVEFRVLGALGESVARVRVPAGVGIDDTVARLQALIPEASVAPHHLYRPSAVPGAPLPDIDPARPSVARTPIGIIDTGIEPVTAALRAALITTRGFAGDYVPREHGTLVGDIAARGGAGLVSADVFGTDTNDEPASPALALASALDWLMAERLRVINISIEGPDNPVLARVIRRVMAADVMIVAAAGNSGPRAPPAFPAAYPGVIAVTAVDARGRVYRRANRGDYVMFAARGVDVSLPLPGGGVMRESGTSFAAPLVAAALAAEVDRSPRSSSREFIAALLRSARDLGEPGRDQVFGWGEISLDAAAPVVVEATRTN